MLKMNVELWFIWPKEPLLERPAFLSVREYAGMLI